MPVEHRSPRDVVALLQGEAPPRIIDVREPWEWEIAHVDGSELIPLSALPERANSLNPHRAYVLLCHHGMRSEMAARWLAQHGFTQLTNVEGGIDAWSQEVDPGLARY